MNARLPLSASLRLLLAALLLAGAVASAPAEVRTVTDPAAPRALPADGPVSVDWTDPAKFSEIRQSGNRWEAERGDWVVQLARYLRQRAATRLPAGQTLDVTLTDIRRAGNYESWHGPRGNDVRIVRDLYPPRIELHFVLHGAGGAVLAQGQRKLSDLGFLQDATRLDDSDPLRFEKRLIDDWLRREFPAGGKPAA